MAAGDPMNHRLLAHVSAILSLIGVSPCLVKAAKSDFDWLLRVQAGLASLPPNQLAIKEAECQANTLWHQSDLRRKTFFSLAWVLSAMAVAVLVLPVTPIHALTRQQAFAAVSVFCFSWATLGRLGWNERSYKGSTIFEELDTVIFWVLYWLGTLSGVAAVVNAAA